MADSSMHVKDTKDSRVSETTDGFKGEELISRNLSVPFVTIFDAKLGKCYLCSNGVMFTDTEYKAGINLKAEYKARARKGDVYDYEHAKKTGELIRAQKPEKEPSEHNKNNHYFIIAGLLALTSVISMYISTLHTADYLTEYTGLGSAWLMSASVTAYNSTALEVAVIFKKRQRYLLTCLFLFLWGCVTFFSMATTVSVFYDRYNFIEIGVTESNEELDTRVMQMQILQERADDLKSAIEFKRADITYRQEKDYSTTAVRTELFELEKELSKVQTQMQELASEGSVTETAVRRETFFSFIARLAGINAELLEFIMSTLSAIFINLIAPLSLTACTELVNNEKEKD